MAEPNQAETSTAGQRLDKWLWFARVIKSRTQAAALVTDGKVRVDRERAGKPSLTVRPGDVITVNIRGTIRVLRVLAPGLRRGPAAEAQTLYEEVTPAVPKAAANAARAKMPSGHELAGEHIGQRDAGSGRPTKRERRLLTRLTDNNEG